MGITLTGCIAMVLFAGRFGGILESSYEIDRVWLLSQGKVPYIDFEWPFGVFFLYGPLWLTKILHLSVIQSYDLFWTRASVAGIGLLFATVNLVDYASERKTPIFLLLYAATLFSIGLMGAYVVSNLTDLFTALKHKALKGNPLHLIEGDLVVAPVIEPGGPGRL